MASDSSIRRCVLTLSGCQIASTSLFCEKVMSKISFIIIIITISFNFFIIIILFLFGILLLKESKSQTITLWKRDCWGLSISNDENVAKTGGEGVSVGILNVSNIEGTWMLFYGLENTDSTNIVSTDKINSSTVDTFDHGLDFTVLKVYLDSVLLLDLWMWESDWSSVMSNNVWDLWLSNILFDNFAQFELCLFGINSMRLVSSSNVKENSEVLISFVNRNDVHLTKRESVFSSHFTINFNHSFSILYNLHSFLSRKSIFQSLHKKNVKWNALS